MVTKIKTSLRGSKCHKNVFEHFHFTQETFFEHIEELKPFFGTLGKNLFFSLLIDGDSKVEILISTIWNHDDHQKSQKMIEPRTENTYENLM